MASKKRCATAVCAVMMLFIGYAAAQEPPKTEAVLRFDEAKREAVAEEISPRRADTADRLPYACKLNRRRVDEAKAYDAVTLWNVRRVRIKDRRMRLSDSTRREKVTLLKFFIERDRRKGARPRLLGNVAGYSWSASPRKDRGGWRISAYTLRSEFDSLRQIRGSEAMFRVPEELWHALPPDARYELNGMPAPADVFRFIDGLILRTLDIVEEEPGKWAVIGRTYPDRMPLVYFGGEPATIDLWLRMCTTGAFSSSADVQMYYFYMLPLEAVQRYGPQGMYGAICIELAE